MMTKNGPLEKKERKKKVGGIEKSRQEAIIHCARRCRDAYPARASSPGRGKKKIHGLDPQRRRRYFIFFSKERKPSSSFSSTDTEGKKGKSAAAPMKS